jgi:hypothetical protein
MSFGTRVCMALLLSTGRGQWEVVLKGKETVFRDQAMLRLGDAAECEEGRNRGAERYLKSVVQRRRRDKLNGDGNYPQNVKLALTRPSAIVLNAHTEVYYILL